MWLHRALDDILSTKSKVAVLRVVCAANSPLHGREIARRAGLASSVTSVVLRELTASGVLTSRDRGRAKTYEITNDECEPIRQLRTLFAAERRRYRQVISGLAEAVPQVLSVVLFGSEARGEAVPGSDTDVLIVVARNTQRVQTRLRDSCLDLAERHSLDLSWHVADLNELREWEETKEELWLRILNDGMVLKGTSLEGLRRRCQRGKSS